ncbi:MAG: glycosyltransferase [bacterium]|nr:glycosyltransferase [bacterium]
MNRVIIIFQRILPHYRVGVFKEFIRKFPGTEIFYGQPFKGESLSNAVIEDSSFIKCKNIYFGRKENFFVSNIYGKLFRQKPGIIITVFNVGNLNIYFLFFLKIFLKHKIILWSFGYDPVRGFDPGENFADKVRLYLSQKADAVIFYWDKGLDEVSKFSNRKDHYFVARNTIDTTKQSELKKTFDITGRENLKKELGIKEKYHFIYTGRLIEDKQADLLLKAFAMVEKKITDARLTIIGGGPEKKSLEHLAGNLEIKNIIFKGEITDEQTTGKWIYVSDAFVMPGRLGLSVIHSFCFGTPVISQNKKDHFHGEGIGYIKEGLNGYLTEDGNAAELAEKMLLIINDSKLSDTLRENSFHTAMNEGSVENMIAGFGQAIDFVRRNSDKK